MQLATQCWAAAAKPGRRTWSTVVAQQQLRASDRCGKLLGWRARTTVAPSNSSWPPPAAHRQVQPTIPPPPLTAQEPLAFDQLGSLVQQLRKSGEAPKEAVDWMAATLEKLQNEHRDRAALLKRSWSDSPFEDGESGNEETLEKFEVELVGMLKNSTNGLQDSEILGNAIDLAGAYKKNYKLEKSEAVLLRCQRHAEMRGGAWLVKYLNHLSQVRMKQSRDVEALEMMYEMESLATFSMTEPGGASFYETLYRNMSSALRRMAREDDAALYFTKMVEAARLHKPSLDWMDTWELGILIANRAFHAGQWAEFYRSRDLIAKALEMHRIAEPGEDIMRAKILSNLGQCYLATKEFIEADKYYSEAYDLFSRTVGKRSPLFGMQAWACGNLRCAEGKYAEALPLLGEALYVEVTKDGLSVSEMNKLADQMLGSLHELSNSVGASTFSANTEPIQRSLGSLITDPRWWRLEESVDLGVLSHKFALIHVVARWKDEGLRKTALQYNSHAVRVLRGSPPSQEARQWLAQAEAIRQVLGPASFQTPGASVFDVR